MAWIAPTHSTWCPSPHPVDPVDPTEANDGPWQRHPSGVAPASPVALSSPAIVIPTHFIASRLMVDVGGRGVSIGTNPSPKPIRCAALCRFACVSAVSSPGFTRLGRLGIINTGRPSITNGIGSPMSSALMVLTPQESLGICTLLLQRRVIRQALLQMARRLELPGWGAELAQRKVTRLSRYSFPIELQVISLGIKCTKQCLLFYWRCP